MTLIVHVIISKHDKILHKTEPENCNHLFKHSQLQTDFELYQLQFNNNNLAKQMVKMWKLQYDTDSLKYI